MNTISRFSSVKDIETRCIHTQAIHFVKHPHIPTMGLFSEALCEMLPVSPHLRLLDIGCGSGVIGIYALLRGAQYVQFNDINAEAIDVVMRNTRLNGILDGYACLTKPFSEIQSLRNDINLLTFNPPQLPGDLVDISYFNADEKTFRDGGSDGLSIVRQFLTWYVQLPYPTPACIITLSSILQERLIKKLITDSYGLTLELLRRKRLPLRDILVESLCQQNDHNLQQRGIVCINNRWYKHLMVLRLSKPASYTNGKKGNDV